MKSKQTVVRGPTGSGRLLVTGLFETPDIIVNILLTKLSWSVWENLIIPKPLTMRRSHTMFIVKSSLSLMAASSWPGL